MQRKFYVSHEMQQMGPFTVDEIVDSVQSGRLSPLDYIYDDEKSDWITFIEHNLLSEKIKVMKPKAPPPVHNKEAEKAHVVKPAYAQKQQSQVHEPMQKEWFVLKGENKFGPFSYTDVIKMLQQGVIYEFDFAWHEGMEGWQRLAEIKYFDKEHLRGLKDSNMPELNEVFYRRRYRRVKYGGTILVHDNKSVWKGQAVEISEGGAGVIMENSTILPGQELYLHFKPGDGVPPFNAICEVVSKQFLSDVQNPKTPIRYGLKFKTVSTETQKVIKEYTRNVA